MNNENLIPFSKRSMSEVREAAAKGGKKSGETRRKKRDMKAKMKMLLDLPCVEDDWNDAAVMGVDPEDIDNETAMLIGLFRKAKTGDVAAVREVRNILGKDNSSEELALKKKELKMKEDQLSGDTAENVFIKAWIDSVIGGDENG